MSQYRIGPLVVSAGERVVFHGDDVVPLAPKSFDLLLLLLQNAGTIVRRETLREAIWGDAFVEEAVISRNVSLLRASLRPYLGEPIETFPKRGYRFVGEVQALDDAQVGSPLQIQDTSESVANGASTKDELADVQPSYLPTAPIIATSANTIRFRMTAASALALLVVCGILIGLRLRSVHAAHQPPPSVAVMDLQDLGGNSATGWIGVVLQDEFRAELAADSGAFVSPPEQTAAVERALGPRGARALTVAEVQDTGRKLGSHLLLTGTYLALNSEVRLDLVLRDATSGNVVDAWSATVPQAQLTALTQQALTHLRGVLKLRPLQKPHTLPFSTADQIAAHYYAEGVALSASGDRSPQVAEAMSQATKADPQFAQAHAALSVALTRLGEGKAADDEAQLALATSAALPEKDRLLCQATAYSQLTNYPAAVAALAELHRRDPGNSDYTFRLAQQTARNGQVPEAFAMLTSLTLQNAPQQTDARVLLALADISGRRGDAKAVLMYAGNALTKAEADGSRFEQAQALLTSGSAWSGFGNYAQGIADLKRSQALFTAIGDREGIIRALISTASVMQGHDDPAASSTAQQAFTAAEQTNEKVLIARALTVVGNIQLTHDQEDSAAESYRQAIAMTEQTHDGDVRLSALSNLGTAELATFHIDEAASHTQQALEIAQGQGNLFQVARCTDQLAEIERYRGDLTPAEKHFMQSVDTWQQLGQITRRNDVLYEALVVLVTQDKLREAHAMLQSIDTKTMSVGDLSLLKTEQARLTAAEGNESLAESMAADSAQTANSVNYSMVALELLAELQLQRNDLPAARSTIDTMSTKLKLIPTDKDAEMQVSLLQARLATFTGDSAGAQRRLDSLLASATKTKDKELLLRVKLAQAQLDQQRGHGTTSLLSTKEETRRDGFELLARSADFTVPR